MFMDGGMDLLFTLTSLYASYQSMVTTEALL